MAIFLKVFLVILMSQLSDGAQDLMTVEESDNKIPEYIRELMNTVILFHIKLVCLKTKKSCH